MRRIALLACLALACTYGTAQAGPLRLYPLHAEPDTVLGGRIVDSLGRQVLLRGVNVNSLVDYPKTTRLPASFPLQPKDPARMAAIGWNAVRLGISWSRVETRPFHYDDGYLEYVADTVKSLRRRGLYAILDLREDAWAPATWQAFLADAPGPGDAGLQTRFLYMLYHVAERFAKSPSVAGFDVVNEPGALTPADGQRLASLYARALVAVRAAERLHAGTQHLLFFEPSALWSRGVRGAPPAFQNDGGIVYAPHVYSGEQPVTRNPFDAAVNEAKGFGGAPVVAGEWGAGPAAIASGYFSLHQGYQDQFRIGALLSTWRQSCGDPLLLGSWLAGRVPQVWGEFDVDCRTNQVTGVREALVQQLARAYVRAAPGRLNGQTYDPAAGTFAAWGTSQKTAGALLAFYPHTKLGGMRFAVKGLADARVNRTPGGGTLISARPLGGAWELAATPAPRPGAGRRPRAGRRARHAAASAAAPRRRPGS